MATTASASATPAASQSPLVPYGDLAYWGMVLTAVGTFVEPIAGAAIGTFYITNIVSSVALDKMGLNDLGTMGKVSKTVIAYFLAVASAAGVATGLGVTITATPTLIGATIAIGALFVLSMLETEGVEKPRA